MPTVIDAQGEILSPNVPLTRLPETTNEHLNIIASLLDDIFCIPGTKIRFGLDALVGWVPVLGDLLTSMASSLIIFAAWKRGAARITLARMVGNVVVESLAGSIPLVGDAAHVAWKANRRNYNLLLRDRSRRRRQTWQDWLYVAGLGFVLVALFIVPLILLVRLLQSHGLLRSY